MAPTPNAGSPAADAVVKEAARLPTANRTVPGEVACFDRAFAGSPDGVPEALVNTPCWRPILEVRPEFLDKAEEARAMARLQREKFPALAPAEQGACSGLTETEIAVSPFFYREDIVRIEKDEAEGVVRGVEVRFGAVPGLTPDRLERVVRCHLARAEVMCDPTVTDYCPLVLQGVTADIIPAQDGGVTVRIMAPDEAGAQEVLSRVGGL